MTKQQKIREVIEKTIKDGLSQNVPAEVIASVVLEGLRKKGIHRENQPFDAPPNTGTWVFIPDEMYIDLPRL